jgi:sporulation protein YlmC with PRC-barrel domain
MSTSEKAMMIDIPLDASVECADGLGGRSSYVIIDPTTKQVTHFVVKQNGFHRTQHLVPVDCIVETTPNSIRLRCTKDKLATLKPFIGTGYILIKRPRYDQGWYGASSYIVPEETAMVPVEYRRIPQGELAVHRGAGVKATDGRVGRVDEFLADPDTGHITHLVLREGHLWSHKNVAIPVSAIDRVEEETICLKLDKHTIESLPAIPIRRPAATTRPSS